MNKELLSRISNDEPEWLIHMRKAAFEKFQSLPQPSFKYGLSITLNPNLDLSSYDFSKKIQESSLPKKEGIEILSLKKAIREKESILKKYFLKNELKDKVDALNAAFYRTGCVIVVPKNTHVSEPVKLDITPNPVEISRSLIIAEDNAKLDLILNTTSPNNRFRSDSVEVVAGKNTVVNVADIQNLNTEGLNFSNKYGTTDQDAKINWLTCCLGSKFTRELVFTHLKGQGSSTNNYGFFFASKEQQFDLSATTRHDAPHTMCDMATKGIVDDNAKAVYQGLVRIEKDAPNSNGYQKEDVLVLSETAEADSIPQLEIENNDVRCTHGASIGQIDTEKLFYMQSRGLNEELARKKMVEGFFEPMIQKLHSESLQNDIRKIIIRRMHA